MTTYVIKKASELDVRVEGGAAARPFAVLNVLRAGGFLRAHTWVENGPQGGAPVTLRVTAVLPPAPEKDQATPEAIEAATRESRAPALGRSLVRPWRALLSLEPVRTEREWPLSRSN